MSKVYCQNLDYKFLFFFSMFLFLGCHGKEKHDAMLVIDQPKSSSFKECTPYFRTVLLPNRKVEIRSLDNGKIKTKEQVIVEGQNFIAFYYYNNGRNGNCERTEWFNFALYFEFVNFKPNLEEPYFLPHKQIKTYSSFNSSWNGAGSVNFHQTVGKIIFHDFTEKRLKVSILLYDSSRTKGPYVNAKNLKFKSFEATFYSGDEIEDFTNFEQIRRTDLTFPKKLPRE